MPTHPNKTLAIFKLGEATGTLHKAAPVMKIINAIKDFFVWLWNPTSALVQEMQSELEKMGYILPNARIISVEQAVEIIKSCRYFSEDYASYMEEDGVLHKIEQIHHDPFPVLGEEYSVFCCVNGVYLCLRNEDLGRFGEMRQPKRVSNLFESSADNKGVSELGGQSAGDETHGAAAVFAVARDAADGGNADDNAPLEDISQED